MQHAGHADVGHREARRRHVFVATVGLALQVGLQHRERDAQARRRQDGGDNDASGPGRNAERNFRKEKRSNETHRSVTDPEARLYRKGDGQPAKLCYMGHALMENRNGLVVGGRVTSATGTAEREAALPVQEREAL